MNIQSGAPAPVMSERRMSIIGGVLVSIGPISMSLFTPAMPEIVQAFGTTEAAVKMTLSLYFAGFAFAQLICGPLSDGFGRKPVAISFMSIYLVGSLLAAVAPSIEVLIAARIIQGFGAAAGVAIARAVVRDLFTHERSARVMNVMGAILAIGPGFAPTLGGFTMELAGWHAIFLLMVAFGVGIILTIAFGMTETVQRDLSRVRPRAVIAAYRTLLSSPHFVLCSLILGGSIGALYTQATVLPFIMIDRVGLSATEFGASMLFQSGSYFFGSLAARQVIRLFGMRVLAPTGLGFVGLGAFLIAVLPRIAEPSLFNIMGPVAFGAFGIAFLSPVIMTAVLAPFPHIAGAASALSGFVQMGSGLVGGSLCAWIGEPVVAMSTVIPAMGATAFICWLIWRRMPEPAVRVPTL